MGARTLPACQVALAAHGILPPQRPRGGGLPPECEGGGGGGPVPAASAWSLAILAAMVLAAGALVLRGRRFHLAGR